MCVCVRSGRVCARPCIGLPGVLVKYSKIDLTPKALSASQSGREEDLFLVLLVPPCSCLSSSLCPCNFFYRAPSSSLSLPLAPHLLLLPCYPFPCHCSFLSELPKNSSHCVCLFRVRHSCGPLFR